MRKYWLGSAYKAAAAAKTLEARFIDQGLPISELLRRDELEEPNGSAVGFKSPS